MEGNSEAAGKCTGICQRILTVDGFKHGGQARGTVGLYVDIGTDEFSQLLFSSVLTRRHMKILSECLREIRSAIKPNQVCDEGER